MKRLVSHLCAGLLLCLIAAQVIAQESGPSYAIRAGRIYPVANGQPWLIENGIIIVRNGRIEAIGRDIAIPPDLRVYDWPDATITPGFVLASSGVAGEHRGDESVGAGYRAADAFNQYGDYHAWLSGGVTTVHLNPGWHRLITGRGAIVRLGGEPASRVLSESADLTINLGDRVGNPPNLIKELVPPTGDTAILPASPQRPTTRLAQVLALREAIQAATRGDFRDPFGDYDMHLAALADAWSNRAPLRIHAQQAADLDLAMSFLTSAERPGYLVGGADAVQMLEPFDAPLAGLVYTLDPSFRSPAGNLGGNPDAVDQLGQDLARLKDVKLALGLAPGQSVEDLRLAAIVALRSGLSEEQVLSALTRVPAELMGVADRVGSLAPGRDADFLVMNGAPLATSAHVQRAYVQGRKAYDAEAIAHARSDEHAEMAGGTVVVRAGTIWLGPNEWLHDGEVLIEDGRIRQVGRRVATPPGARVIDAGSDSFVTPGMIDAYGHLGLEGDRTTPSPDLSLAAIIGPADYAARRVAGAGVTTVMLAPYNVGGAGAQMSAVKTDGRARHDRVVSETAAVLFDVSRLDHKAVGGQLKNRLEAGKRYLKLWEDYRKALAEWEKKKAEGTLEPVQQPQVEEQVTEQRQEDPITGTWSIRVFGGPLPQEVEGKVAFRLNGSSIEGRITEPDAPVEHRIIGTLNDKSITGTIEVDTGGMGTPTWTATLTATDRMTGQVTLAGFATLNFEANRTDKAGVEFRVTRSRRRTTGEDGRPLPPKIDESLEPLRKLLEKQIPAVVTVDSSLQVEEVIKVMTDENGLSLVLVNAPGANLHAAKLKEKGIGVVLPTNVLQRDGTEWRLAGDVLNRAGVPVAFQSDAEDGARSLPLVALFAVERGLSPEQALAALTVDAAKMYGLGERVGSIAPGLEGDLVIFSGHPFAAGSRVERVIVGGREVRP